MNDGRARRELREPFGPAIYAAYGEDNREQFQARNTRFRKKTGYLLSVSILIATPRPPEMSACEKSWAQRSLSDSSAPHR